MAERDLERLMACYQQGDRSAATTLIREVSPQLRRFFVIQLSSRRDADDLLQETWLRIHDVRHTYRPGEPLLPWLYAIARHVRIDHYRKQRRKGAREEHLQDIGQIAAAPQAAQPADANDLEVLLATLPESQREVIQMLKISGMSIEEVARATSSSIGSVKQKAHRAYNKLREYLGAAASRKSGKGGAS
jgi:RNA polymerase sigma-70 factor (ECF subfamily)